MAEKILSCERPAWRLKEIAAEMGGLCERSVKRWWQKAGVPPDNRAGAHTWTQKKAEKIVLFWRQHWTQRGHWPEAMTEKFTGGFKPETGQLDLPLQEKFNFEKQNGLAPEKRILPGAVGKTHARPKTRGDDAPEKTGVANARR